MIRPNYKAVPQHLNNMTNFASGMLSVAELGDGAPVRIFTLIGMIVTSMVGMGYSYMSVPRTHNLYTSVLYSMMEEGVVEHGNKVINYMESLEKALSNGNEIPTPPESLEYIFDSFCIATPGPVE